MFVIQLPSFVDEDTEALKRLNDLPIKLILTQA